MTPELISRIVGLVKRQGDRVVIADSATGKAVVIMDLEQYEALTDPEGGVPAPATPARTAPAADEITFRAPPDLAIPPRHLPAAEPAPTPRIEPRVEAPRMAPPIAHKTASEKPQKTAKTSENPFKKRAAQLGVETALETTDLTDLTQTELLDKINRDIGDWKTAQERKRTDELQSAAKRPERFETASAVEEEERFYLEPIE